MKQPVPFGKYYLLERINVGGMAEVFRAKAYGVEGFERLVAVKRILPNIAEDKEFIGMFIDEAKIAVQLNHANIAQIFDLGMVDGSYYIALEHVHGRDLRSIFDQCVQRGQPMPVAQSAFIVMKVCEGLDYAHNKKDQSGRDLNLVHRDVSPQNVLVSFEGEVKLIDFGIAKAVGKGAQTQAGILKGKFGYMSPEQVRGLPIDRRADIFSCGIVLYELLTGERLFVGGSDFSTLEKVRNVEILPPSTYNRKIPDELERIVLKALAKDVEDRYQNAIDLHDDLQAFVYTAGEFYSRKDLAGWMRDTFKKEMAEEMAKLEEYRQFRPPEMRPQARRATVTAASGQRRNSTLAMPSVASPKQAPARPRPSTSKPPPPPVLTRDPDAPPLPQQGEELNWDEDELETQIFKGDKDSKPGVSAPKANKAEEEAAARAGMELANRMTMPIGPEDRVVPTHLAATAPIKKGGAPPVAAGLAGSAAVSMAAPAALAQAQDVSFTSAPPVAPARERLAVGSSPSPSPFREAAEPKPAPALPERAEYFPTEALPIAPPQPRQSGGLYVALSLLVFALLGGAVGGYFLFFHGKPAKQVASNNTAAATSLSPAAGAAAAGQPPSVAAPETARLDKAVLEKTGFDLIVQPTEARVSLDGKQLNLAPPMKVRNITPGVHELAISGPVGFHDQTVSIDVKPGAAELVEVSLQPKKIKGRFVSEPAGATVTLLVNKQQEIPLGAAPAEHVLDPRNTYDVRFAKDGYISKTEPVALSGDAEEAVSVTLEKAAEKEEPKRVSRQTDRRDRDGSGAKSQSAGSSSGSSSGSSGGSDAGKSAEEATGTLMLGAKPTCKILVDGKDTGKTTPIPNLVLPAGKRRITLVNDVYGIRETFTVTIKAGETVKQIKDYSDKMQQQ